MDTNTLRAMAKRTMEKKGTALCGIVLKLIAMIRKNIKWGVPKDPLAFTGATVNLIEAAQEALLQNFPSLTKNARLLTQQLNEYTRDKMCFALKGKRSCVWKKYQRQATGCNQRDQLGRCLCSQRRLRDAFAWLRMRIRKRKPNDKTIDKEVLGLFFHALERERVWLLATTVRMTGPRR